LRFFVGCQGVTERRRVKLERPQPPVAARTYELDVAGRDGAKVVDEEAWVGPLQVDVRRVSSNDLVARGWACPGLGSQSSLRHAQRGVVGMELMRGVDRGGLNQTTTAPKRVRGS
jgi:hypothetical protein